MSALRHVWCVAKVTLALVAGVLSFEAQAAYSCSISITAMLVVYSPSVATNNDSTGTYTMNCTRAAGDAAAMPYTLRANNGIHSGGTNPNRAQLGANSYTYDVYRNAGFTQLWGGAGGTDIDNGNTPVNFGAALSATFSGPFYLRVPGGQSTLFPAGDYTDNVTITLNPGGAGNTVTTALLVTVRTTNSCQITVAPGNMSFNYTSMQGAAASANTTYGVRCTSLFPYTMSLDGTQPYNLLGLDYTLSIPGSSTGTGLTQTHTIDGNIAAGQAGACATTSCSGSRST